MTVSGPMFESSSDAWKAQPCLRCGNRKDGAHYNHFSIAGGMAAIRKFFPDAKANEMNFALFSTSGVHGTYTTIEDIESSLKKYGPTGYAEGENYPDDAHGNNLTVLIVQPRICCLRYGTVDVTLDDIEYLKRLRQSSWEAVNGIGRTELPNEVAT